MQVINKNYQVIEWEDSDINRARLATGNYGVELFEGDTELGDDGLLYKNGFAYKKSQSEINDENIARIDTELDSIAKSVEYSRAYEELSEAQAFGTQPSQFAIDKVKEATLKKEALREERKLYV